MAQPNQTSAQSMIQLLALAVAAGRVCRTGDDGQAAARQPASATAPRRQPA